MSTTFLKLERKNGKEERNKRTEKKNGAKEKSIEIAKEMLKEKMPIDKIMKYTGLEKKEIEKIIEK